MKHDAKSVDKLLRSLRPPEFRNEEHQARLLGELASPDAAANSAAGKQTNRLERLMNNWKQGRAAHWRWAALAASVLLIAAIFWGMGGDPSSRALAQAIQKLRQATKMSCIVHTKDNSGFETQVKLQFKAPGLIREEHGDGAVTVVDLKTGKQITLLEKEKKYIEMKLWGAVTSQSQSMDMLAEFRRLPLEAEKQLGRKRIGKVDALGFEQKSNGLLINTWVDTDTQNPVRIEITPKDNPSTQIAITDIVFDPPLDDALFSLKPPAGHTAAGPAETMQNPTNEDLAAFFGVFAKYTGAFPDSLNMVSLSTQLKSIGIAHPEINKGPLEQRVKLSQQILSGLIMANGITTDQRNEWKYVGKGCSPKNGSTPIFWYRPWKDSQYHIITADLQVKLLDAKDFPTTALYQDPFVQINESADDHGSWWQDENSIYAKGQTLESLAGVAYSDRDGWLDTRLPNTLYDVRVEVQQGGGDQLRARLRHALEAQFNLTTHTETRMTDVYILTAPPGRPAALRDPKNKNGSTVDASGTQFGNMYLGCVTDAIGKALGKLVLNETGLDGRYDYEFTAGKTKDPQALAAAVRNQLKLNLLPAKRELKFLVIETRKQTK